MARVTVEDCLARVPNRFALTILASRRARALLEGKGKALVKCENKSAVTALREISADKVRFIEDVDTVLVDFIAEQRTRLQASTGDGYIDAAAFGMEGEDVTEDIEELTADLEKLVAADDDDDDATESDSEDGADDDDADADVGDDDTADLGDLEDDTDIDDTDDDDDDDDDDDV